MANGRARDASAPGRIKISILGDASRRRAQPETIENKRLKLRSTLANSLKSDEAEALAEAADEFRRQELEMDLGLEPALEFMALMGVSHDTIFKGFLQQLQQSFSDALRGSSREMIEKVLDEMVPHIGAAHVRELMSHALQRLAALPPPSALERTVFSKLADALLEDPGQLEQLPSVVQRRVWEKQPALFQSKIVPWMAGFVHGLRQRQGRLLVELKKVSPQQRREDETAVRALVELVGAQRDLYLSFSSFVSERFRSSMQTGEPAVRHAPRAGSDGAPVSMGAETYLSTVHSQVLLALLERRVLVGSIVGTWAITSEFQGGAANYSVTFTQKNCSVGGTSQLRGVTEVVGSIENYKLSFKQLGPRSAFVCRCTVSPDLLSLTDGTWHEERPGVGTSQQLSGTFTGSRVGAVSFIDADGDVWDDNAALVLALDRIHQKPRALDLKTCSEIQQVAKGVAAAPDRGASRRSVDFTLMDPCVLQSMLRGLTFQKGDDMTSLVEPLDASHRTVLQLLLCVGRQMCDLRPDRGSPSSSFALDFEALAGGPPSPEMLAAAGLPCDRLAACFRMHSQKDIEALIQNGGRPSAELSALLASSQQDWPRRAATHTVLRMILNTLSNKCFLLRQRFALEECLLLAAQHVQFTGVDWVHRQLVDALVSTAVDLGERFDAVLRRIVTAYLFPLAVKDAHVHFRVTELLSMYMMPNFSSSREEIKSFELLLKQGACVDKYYDWRWELAQAYIPIAQTKSYLLSMYRKSALGQSFPAELSTGPI